jgi:hypothetical protein
VGLKIVLLDNLARPDFRHQFVLAEKLPAPPDECEQQIERPRPDIDGRAIEQELPLSRDELKPPEAEHPRISHGRR